MQPIVYALLLLMLSPFLLLLTLSLTPVIVGIFLLWGSCKLLRSVVYPHDD